MKKRVPYQEMVDRFARVLESRGFQPGDAVDAAEIFAQNSLAGVYSHGLNRFPESSAIWIRGTLTPLPVPQPRWPSAPWSSGTAIGALAR